MSWICGPDLLAQTRQGGQPSLQDARDGAMAVLDSEQFLGAVATIAAFVLLNRVSDSYGIPLDEMVTVLLANYDRQM